MKSEMTIPADTTLIGELRTNSKIIVEGRVEGSGLINNTLLISSGAVWVGNIIADVVIIDGAVRGNIVAKQKLLCLSNAKVFGSLYSKNIHVDPGAAVTGKIQMNTPAPFDLINDPASYSLKATVLEPPMLSTTVLGATLLDSPSTESRSLGQDELGEKLNSPPRKLTYQEVDVA